MYASELPHDECVLGPEGACTCHAFRELYQWLLHLLTHLRRPEWLERLQGQGRERPPVRRVQREQARERCAGRANEELLGDRR